MLVAFNACSSGGDSGGGGGGDTLTGTAAAGAPIIGNVIVKGANGGRVQEVIEADGTYNIDVSSLTAPYMLRAEGTVGGRRYEIHSFAHESDLGGTINITPFTDLIVSNAAGQIAANYFAAGDFSGMDEADIDAQETALQEKLQEVLTSLGVADTVNLLTTSFNTDHTALDAALDLISVEYDSTTNIATLTNLIDNTSMIDNIIDDAADDAGSLEVVSDLGDAQDELVAIANRMETFSAMITANNFTSTDLEAYLGDAFLMEDESKSEWATNVASEDTSAIELVNLVITDLDMDASTANVTITFMWQGMYDDEETWKVQKINNTWLILGDGAIVEYYTTYAHCNRYENISGFVYGETGGCGINASVEDNNPNNNNGAGAILSATVDVMRNDSVVANSTTYLGEDAPGELSVYYYDANSQTGYYRGDWVGDFRELDYSLQAGDKFRFQLYATALDLSDPALPSVSGAIVATYYDDDVPATPKVNPTTSDYPAFSQATKDALETMDFPGGNLTISFTIPDGQILDGTWYEAWDDNGNSIEVDTDDQTITGNSVTINVDLSNFNSSGGTVYQQLRIYTVDEDWQEYSTFYQAEDIQIP